MNLLESLVATARKKAQGLEQRIVGVHPAPAPTALPRQGQPGFGVMRPGAPMVHQVTTQQLHPTLGQRIQHAVVNVGKEAGLGIARVGTGIAQDTSGLVDLATPGTGNSRVTQALARYGRNIDTQANKVSGPAHSAYKIAQVSGNIGSFMLPSTVVSGVSKIPRVVNAVDHVAPAVRVASKVAAPFDKSVARVAERIATKGRVGRMTAAGIHGAASTAGMTNAAAGTAASLGNMSSRGQDISRRDVLEQAALNEAGAFALPAVASGATDLIDHALPGAARALKSSRNAMRTAQSRENAAESVQKQLTTNRVQRRELQKQLKQANNAGLPTNHPTVKNIHNALQKNIEDEYAIRSQAPQRSGGQAIADKVLTARPGLSMKRVTGHEDLTPQQHDFIGQYAEMLKGMGQGNGVSNVRTSDGGYVRMSNNVRPADMKGKRMTNADWFDQARKEIESGNGAYGASDEYKQLSNKVAPTDTATTPGTVMFNGEPHTIAKSLKIGGSTKYQLVGPDGREVWTNQAGLDSARKSTTSAASQATQSAAPKAKSAVKPAPRSSKTAEVSSSNGTPMPELSAENAKNRPPAKPLHTPPKTPLGPGTPREQLSPEDEQFFFGRDKQPATAPETPPEAAQAAKQSIPPVETKKAPPARNADAERTALDILQKGGTNDAAVYQYMKDTGKGLQDAVHDVGRASKEAGITFDAGKNPLLGTVSVPKVAEGDFAQANHNSKFVQAHEERLGKQAMDSFSGLSNHDKVLLRDIEAKPVDEVAKNAENPEAFSQAAKNIRTYYDTRHAYDHMLGIDVGYRANYLRHIFDRAETAPDLPISTKNGTKNPGYKNARVNNDTLAASVGDTLQRDINGSSYNHAKLTYEKGLNEAFPDKVANGEIVRTPADGTYQQLLHPFGQSLSVPKDIAHEINSRTWQKADSKTLETYDKINHGLKYAKLSGGLFHAVTESGNFIGQQLASGKMIKDPLATGKLFKVFFSSKAMNAELGRMESTGVLDKARLSGLTLRPKEILADANVNLRAKAVDKVTKYTGLQAMHDATFQREIPYAKAKIFEQKTEGLDVNKPEDLQKMRQIAREVNQIFGGIDRTTSGIKPGTFKWLQRGILATDFTEGKWHTLSDALTSKGPAGNLARQTVAGKAVLFGVLATAGAATGGQYAGKNPGEFARDAAGNLLDPSFQMGGYTAKFPKTHISEAIDALKPYSQAKGAPWNASGVQHYAASRLAALPSEVTQLLSNKDYYGQPIYGNKTKKNGGGPISPAGVAVNIANTVGPIPFGQGVSTAQGKQNAAAAAANVAGLNVRPTPAPKTGSTGASSQTAADAIKAAFNNKEGKAFLALSDADKKAAAATDPETRALYDQWQNLKTAFAPNQLHALGLDPKAAQILDKYAHLTAQGRQKYFNDNKGAEADYLEAKYLDDKESGKLSGVEDIRRQEEVQKAVVGSDFDKQTRDIYGLSKAEIYKLVSTNPDGKSIAARLVKYGDALEANGLADNKLRDSNGNVAIQPKAKGSSGGRSASSLISLAKQFKTPYSDLIKTSHEGANIARSAGLAKKKK